PVIGAGIATNAPRPRVAAARTLGLTGARDVTFPASDGVRLAGWYVPGHSGAAVIVLHGSHGTRGDALRHVRMLAAAGVGVLAFDARGHGASGGQTNALGWEGARDVAGAVRFLAGAPGVDPRRIAALGLSMGGEEALRAAAEGVALRAVVADGAGASTLADERLTSGGAIPTSVGWVTMRATELFSGEREPASLGSEVARIRVPVLLIASGGRAGERAIDAIYAERIGRRASLWFVPGAAHTRALQTHPRAYAARVGAFLAAALRRGPGPPALRPRRR
ncbi:MAG: alpha/beta hydrolase, partial [Solirubrobacteraceae bacterium]